MKCQRCERPATFHITELTGDGVVELHLCEHHAGEYLVQHEEPTAHASTTFAGALAQHMKVGQTAEELARLDQQACPVCGITFYEFRSQGRLGCPHDYEAFESELMPLLVNIHGEMEHHGKRPARCALGSQRQSELIRLRRELKECVEVEDYERASVLRDEIRKIEQQSHEA